MEYTTTRVMRSHLKMCVYGDAGVGKTKLCGTAPNPVIISAEAGLLTLANMDLPVIEIAKPGDLQAAFKQVKKDMDMFDTVCIDSLSEIAEVLLAAYKPNFKDKRQAYGQMADEMMDFTKAFRGFPKHVLMTSKMKPLEDEHTGIVTYRPFMPGKAFTDQLPYYFDVVACMRVKQKGQRYLQMQPSPTHLAKTRDPFGVVSSEEEPDMRLLIDKIMNGETNVTTA